VLADDVIFFLELAGQATNTFFYGGAIAACFLIQRWV